MNQSDADVDSCLGRRNSATVSQTQMSPPVHVLL